jgi:thiamine biosynthesis protein ThiI
MRSAMQVLVHYHEIALKGGNRPFFVRCLADNLRRATADLGKLHVHSLAGRLALEAPDGLAWEPLRDRIATVFGVANFGRARRVEPDITALKAAAVAAARESPAGSFRVTTRRSDKSFPLGSMQIDREVGAAVQAATGLRVDLTRPELTLLVEVLRDRIYCSAERLQGPGGFPTGSSGRVMALLSGGIDSPVAAWRMMKRGCRVLLAHFHAFPLQDHTTIDKARSLARTLARYQFVSQLLLVPFGPAQQAIVACCPAPLRVVLYRRLMLRIAEALAGRHRAKALVTGDSLGQVASQTLHNLATIDEAARGPVLRPLVGMDKQEIVEQAQRIGTFDTSTLPDQDCCQLFVPRSPATAARIGEVQAAEQALDLAGLLAAAVAATEEERFLFPVLQSPAS